MLKKRSGTVKIFESFFLSAAIIGFGACSGSATSTTSPAAKNFEQLSFKEQLNTIQDQMTSFVPLQGDPNLTASTFLSKESRFASLGRKVNNFLFPSLMAGQTTFADIWETSQLIASNYCDNSVGCQPTYEAIRDRLRQELDVNFVPQDNAPLNLFSQQAQIEFIPCIINSVVGDASPAAKDPNDDLIVPGIYSLVLPFSQVKDTSSIFQKRIGYLGCNLLPGGLQSKEDVPVTLTVSNTTNNSFYKKYYLVTLPDSSTISIYLKRGSGITPFNMSILQVSANRLNAERAIISVVDGATLIDYVSQDYGATAGSANSFRFYRSYINFSPFVSNKSRIGKGYLISGRDSFNAVGSPTSPNPHGSQFLHFSIAARPWAMMAFPNINNTAFSLEMQDQRCNNPLSPLCNNGYTDPTLTAGSFNACINAKNGIVVPGKDGSLACGGGPADIVADTDPNSLLGSDVSAAGRMMRATYAAHAAGPATYTLTESMELNWTDPTGDMITAVQAN